MPRFLLLRGHSAFLSAALALLTPGTPPLLAADPPAPLLLMQLQGCGADVPADNVMARLGLELDYEVTDTLRQGDVAKWRASVVCGDAGGVEISLEQVERAQVRTRVLGQTERSAAVKTRLILVTLVEMVESWEPTDTVIPAPEAQALARATPFEPGPKPRLTSTAHVLGMLVRQGGAMGALELQITRRVGTWSGAWLAASASQSKSLGASLGTVDVRWFSVASGWLISPHDAVHLGLGGRAFLGSLEGVASGEGSRGRQVWEVAAGPLVMAGVQQQVWGEVSVGVQVEAGWAARGMEAREAGQGVWSLSGLWGMIGAGASLDF